MTQQIYSLPHLATLESTLWSLAFAIALQRYNKFLNRQAFSQKKSKKNSFSTKTHPKHPPSGSPAARPASPRAPPLRTPRPPSPSEWSAKRPCRFAPAGRAAAPAARRFAPRRAPLRAPPPLRQSGVQSGHAALSPPPCALPPPAARRFVSPAAALPLPGGRRHSPPGGVASAAASEFISSHRGRVSSTRRVVNGCSDTCSSRPAAHASNSRPDGLP